MKRPELRSQINKLLKGKDPDSIIEIYILNPSTGERTLYGQFPNDKKLIVEADSPETAKALLDLRKGGRKDTRARSCKA